MARTLPVVVGAHLIAEANHRSIAAHLRDACAHALAEINPGVTPLLCTDLWYLNNDELRVRPTISVGSPGLNALTAFLADKLPTAFAVDGVLAIQYDAEFTDLACAVWGVDTPSTAKAVGLFIEGHLGDVLDRFFGD